MLAMWQCKRSVDTTRTPQLRSLGSGGRERALGKRMSTLLVFPGNLAMVSTHRGCLHSGITEDPRRRNNFPTSRL